MAYSHEKRTLETSDRSEQVCHGVHACHVSRGGRTSGCQSPLGDEVVVLFLGPVQQMIPTHG